MTWPWGSSTCVVSREETNWINHPSTDCALFRGIKLVMGLYLIIFCDFSLSALFHCLLILCDLLSGDHWCTHVIVRLLSLCDLLFLGNHWDTHVILSAFISKSRRTHCTSRSYKIGGARLTIICFADSSWLIAKSNDELEEMTKQWLQMLNSRGLVVERCRTSHALTVFLRGRRPW